jgi:hypothetical protein
MSAPAAPVSAPATEPGARSPIEKVAEIFEALFAKVPEPTAELLGALGRCNTSALAKLFDSPSTPPIRRPSTVRRGATCRASSRRPAGAGLAAAGRRAIRPAP